MTLRTVVTSRPAARALARLRAWPVASQQRARRNAMVAATRCAQRRVEREEVATFLSERYASSVQDAAAAPAERESPAARPRRAARG